MPNKQTESISKESEAVLPVSIGDGEEMELKWGVAQHLHGLPSFEVMSTFEELIGGLI